MATHLYEISYNGQLVSIGYSEDEARLGISAGMASIGYSSWSSFDLSILRTTVRPLVIHPGWFRNELWSRVVRKAAIEERKLERERERKRLLAQRRDADGGLAPFSGDGGDDRVEAICSDGGSL